MRKLKILHIGEALKAKLLFEDIPEIEYEFLELISEKEALYLLKFEKFDIILIDEKLLKINGIYLADIIKKRERENKTETTIFIMSKNREENKNSDFKNEIVTISEKYYDRYKKIIKKKVIEIYKNAI